jgi:hypothetical protein
MIYRTLVLAATATLLSTSVFAQGQALSDQDYCYELANLYRSYARFNQVNVAAAEAMSNCDKGNPTAAIATLEKILTSSQITLPKQKP